MITGVSMLWGKSAAPVASGDPYWRSVVCLVAAEGANGSTTITDSSAFARALTPAGNAQISTTHSRYSTSSLRLDGAGDKVTAPISGDLDFGTGDFTIELDFRLVSHGAAGIFDLYYTCLVGCMEQNTPGAGWGLWLIGTAAAKTQLSFNNGLVGINANYTFLLDTWYNVRVTRKDGTVYAFVDGTLITSVALAANLGVSKKLNIGNHEDTVRGDTFMLDGYVDNLRITKGVCRSTLSYTLTTVPHPTSL